MTPEIDNNTRKNILAKALMAHHAEEKLLSLYGEGRLRGTVHTCIGQEFVGATISEHLLDGDALFSNHRCHGHYLSRTGDLKGLFHEIFGLTSGACGGVGGSQHLYNNQFYSNGIQGGMAPVSLGIALGKKFKASQNIAVAFIGDGTLGEGVLYETLNIAAKWQVPLLFVLENNGYSQSTRQDETLSGTINERFSCFGLPVYESDTWQWEDLYHTSNKAVGFVREHKQPALLHIKTFRLKAHSKGDDDRPESLISTHLKKDPLYQIISNPSKDELLLIQEINAAIEGALPAQADFNQLVQQSKSKSDLNPLATKNATFSPVILDPATSRLVKEINTAFHELMAQNSKVLFFGEDIEDPYGGAFKISKGLSTAFGARVRNTPISEAAIVGMGTGLSLEGFVPFIEIMFGDFLGLAFDQILNHASKFESMYAKQVKVDLVVRTPMGGRRGYGPTHSQSLENHFLGIPGLTVLAINHIVPPKDVYPLLAKGGFGPVLLIENKTLYTEPMLKKLPDGFLIERSDDAFPVSLIRPMSSSPIDVVLVGYGGMTPYLLEILADLFYQHDILAAIFCPMQIYPLDLKRYAGVFAEASFVAVVEESQGFAGFGSEIITQLSLLNLPLKMLRLSPPECIIPASYDLENDQLPNAKSITEAIVRRVHEL